MAVTDVSKSHLNLWVVSIRVSIKSLVVISESALLSLSFHLSLSLSEVFVFDVFEILLSLK